MTYVSLINLQVKYNLPILRYNTAILTNSLWLNKKTNLYSALFCRYLALLFSLTTVHGVVTGQLAPLRFDPWKVWLLFDNICIECTKV